MKKIIFVVAIMSSISVFASKDICETSFKEEEIIKIWEENPDYEQRKNVTLSPSVSGFAEPISIHTGFYDRKTGKIVGAYLKPETTINLTGSGVSIFSLSGGAIIFSSVTGKPLFFANFGFGGMWSEISVPKVNINRVAPVLLTDTKLWYENNGNQTFTRIANDWNGRHRGDQGVLENNFLYFGKVDRSFCFKSGIRKIKLVKNYEAFRYKEEIGMADVTQNSCIDKLEKKSLVTESFIEPRDGSSPTFDVIIQNNIDAQYDVTVDEKQFLMSDFQLSSAFTEDAQTAGNRQAGVIAAKCEHRNCDGFESYIPESNKCSLSGVRVAWYQAYYKFKFPKGRYGTSWRNLRGIMTNEGLMVSKR